MRFIDANRTCVAQVRKSHRNRYNKLQIQ